MVIIDYIFNDFFFTDIYPLVKQTVQKEQRFKSEIDKLRQANENLISRMTSEHFQEQDEEDYEEEEEYDEVSGTPDCDDNLSSRSSVTSDSSQHIYSFTDLPHQQPISTFEKHQQDLMNKGKLSKKIV
jgi:hypothetical protein